REFLEKKFGIKRWYDWYNITQEDFMKNGGEILLETYGSLSNLVRSLYPKPIGYWNNMENQREFIDWLGKKLGYSKMDDWYRVYTADILQNGGGRLLNLYGGSPIKLIQSIFKEHHWDVHKLSRKPVGYWNNMENQREFMDWLGKKLGYSKMDDWYQISQ